MGELVGVHGIAKHQLGRHQLLPVWKPALADGLERAFGRPVQPPDLDLAFYGDIFLRDFLRDGGEPPAQDGSQTKSADAESVLDGMDEAEWAEVSQELTEAVTPEDVAAAELEEYKAYTRVPRPVQVLLRAADRRFGAAAGILYVGVLRQVRHYLVSPLMKARIDARMQEAVSEGCRVLIGHSLGSVVAYEYLRQHPNHGIDLFLTLGSPLGLRMVRNRLPMVGPLKVPSWVNVRDLRDPVACAGPLYRWWPQIGEQGDRVVDNGGDTHGVERYLCRRTTGEVLLRALPHLATA